MTAHGRGLYGNPGAARSVLAALGGPVERPSHPAGPLPRAYRGRCGNGQRWARYAGYGENRVMVEEADPGCDGEVADPEGAVAGGHNRLKFCERCIRRYRAAMPVDKPHEAALGRRDPMPGLCDHGQRAADCCACVTHPGTRTSQP